MTLRKFAEAQVLEARLGVSGRFEKTAHRAEFDYEPRQGFLYVRSRAISSRTNDNYDNFPGAEIKKAYRTFVGKPVFVNHHNSDHRRARGVIIDAALHEDKLASGEEDTWVEVLMEVDAVRFPKLADKILKGEVDRTSMGTDVLRSTCSACGNVATTPATYCKHIPAMKGQKIRRKVANGEGSEDVLVYEICEGLSFFENSILVEDPADPTAYFLGVDDRGLGGGYQGNVPVVASKPHREDSEMSRTASKRGRVTPRKTSARMGKRFWCSLKDQTGLSFNHDSGEGTPTRKKCSYCGGSFDIEEGMWGVFDYQGNGTAYKVENAHSLHTKEDQAQAAAAGDLVVRWVAERYLNGRTSSRHLAYGEQVAPPKVDTLRDESCPICSDTDSFNGSECGVCGYVKPPDEFMDPDLDMAGEIDLRQESTGDPNAEVEIDEDLLDVEDDELGDEEFGDDEGLEEGVLDEDVEDEDPASQFTIDGDVNAGDPEVDDDEAGPRLKGEQQFSLTQPEDPEEQEIDVEGEPDVEGDADLEEDDSSVDAEDDEDDDAPDPEEDEDEDDDDGNPFAKKKTSRASGQTKGRSPMNTVEALARQRKVAEAHRKEIVRQRSIIAAQRQRTAVLEARLASQGQAIARIAKMAGINLNDIAQGEKTRVAKVLGKPVPAAQPNRQSRRANMRRKADAENPAQPIPDPASQGPTGDAGESAREPGDNSTGLSSEHSEGTTGDVTTVGGEIDNTEADVQTSLMDIGGIVDDTLDLNETDVTAPVSGTETVNEADTTTDGDVTSIDEVRPETAFPLEQTVSRVEKRIFASLHLARLRAQAGVSTEPDDLIAGQKIAQSNMTDREIATLTQELSRVVAGRPQQANQNRSLVPRAASRVAPSMAVAGSTPAPVVATGSIGGSVAADDGAFLFE